MEATLIERLAKENGGLYTALWAFKPKPGLESEFRAFYGPGGEFCKLFEGKPGYVGTSLIEVDGGWFITFDTWKTARDLADFYSKYAEIYSATDKRADAMLEAEIYLGALRAQ